MNLHGPDRRAARLARRKNFLLRLMRVNPLCYSSKKADSLKLTAFSGRASVNVRRQILSRTAVLCALVAAVRCGQKPASINVKPSKVVLYGIGKSAHLMAEVLDKKGHAMKEAPAVTWATSSAKVAQVTPGGTVTAKGEGRSTVTASAGPISTTVPVQVYDVAEIDVAPASARLVGPAGSTLQMVATPRNAKHFPINFAPAWESSSPKVATIDKNGVVRSVAAGKATVMARLGEVEGSADVVVDIRVISRVEIRPTTAILSGNDSQQLTVVAYDDSGRPLQEVAANFATSDPSVATVNGAGVISAKGKGTAVVSASVADKSATVTVIVN